MSTPLHFEGRPLPPDDGLAERICVADRSERAWLVRAAVSHAPLADALTGVARRLVDDRRPHARAVAVEVSEALLLRALVVPLVEQLRADPDRPAPRWAGVTDPLRPARTLAQSAFDFILLAAPRGRSDVRALLRWAMTVPELRGPAWRALGDESPEVALPHLAALLTEAPELAEAVATRFALVHTAHCPAAARAVAALPEPTRRAFAGALEKHLKRISAIGCWVECRRALAGR